MSEKSSHSDHHDKASEHGPVPISIITVSDTRTNKTDVNGQFLKEVIQQEGHHVASYDIVFDDGPKVKSALDRAVASSARIVLINGGTGIARRDKTIDVISGILDKELLGFGELFRALSFQEIGAAAMLSRATAGTYHGATIFCMPGSPAAVRLAWKKLIAPEAKHLAWELIR